MTLLILAGGKGSRYGSEKQFDGVGPNGEYLLEYGIFDAIQAGFKKIVIITKEGVENSMLEYFSSRIPKSVIIKCVPQKIDDLPNELNLPNRSKPLGTAHAIWCARHVIDSPFLTINADDFYGRASYKKAFKQNGYFIVAFPLKKTLSNNGSVSRGICLLSDRYLLGVQEFTEVSPQNDYYIDEITGKEFDGTELVSMNMWGLDEKIFPVIEELLKKELMDKNAAKSGEVDLPTAIQKMINEKKTQFNVLIGEEWVGMTYQEDKASVIGKLKTLISEGIYPAPLWN